MSRSYPEAIEALNSLQSNASVVANIRNSWAALSQNVIAASIEYLGRINYAPQDLNQLNVIHVAGTKGKGSTCAFASAALQEVSPHKKVGLFTSPHLVSVRERIQINGQPISEHLFAKYFWEVWDRLHQNTERAKGDQTSLMPAYFRFMTLLAFHTFVSEKVDVTILEVGIGGTYDSTNIVPQPLVTGITALGIDHVAILGKTLPEIASQKAGIYKSNRPAFASPQPADALEVLRCRAAEVHASSFEVVPLLEEVGSRKLGLAGEHQMYNASLALRLCQQFLLESPSFVTQSSPPSDTTSLLLRGLEKATWPGRCQILPQGKATWFLDGAHTVESLALAGSWFRSASNSQAKRCLVFNCTSDRAGKELLPALFDNCPAFDQVYFCPNITTRSGYSPELTSTATATAVQPEDALAVQRSLSEVWSSVSGSSPPATILPSIQDVVEDVRSQAASTTTGPVEVFVTGSLHLIGGLLSIVQES